MLWTFPATISCCSSSTLSTPQLTKKMLNWNLKIREKEPLHQKVEREGTWITHQLKTTPKNVCLRYFSEVLSEGMLKHFKCLPLLQLKCLIAIVFRKQARAKPAHSTLLSSNRQNPAHASQISQLTPCSQQSRADCRTTLAFPPRVISALQFCSLPLLINLSYSRRRTPFVEAGCTDNKSGLQSTETVFSVLTWLTAADAASWAAVWNSVAAPRLSALVGFTGNFTYQCASGFMRAVSQNPLTALWSSDKAEWPLQCRQADRGQDYHCD